MDGLSCCTAAEKSMTTTTATPSYSRTRCSLLCERRQAMRRDVLNRIPRKSEVIKARVLLLVVSIIAVLVVPLGVRSQLSLVQAAPAAQSARTCQNIQLLIRAQTSQGAAGTIGVIYRIHNLQSQPCTLSGYPGVQFLDRHFASLPTTVHRGGGDVGNVPVRTVTLSPYGNAYFALFYSDVPTINAPPCATAPYLMIFGPNNYLPVVTYAVPGGSITECSGNIHVSPVTAQPTY